MIFQGISSIESLAALVTSITTFATMNQTVLIVNRAGQESLVADCASVEGINADEVHGNFRLKLTDKDVLQCGTF